MVKPSASSIRSSYGFHRPEIRTPSEDEPIARRVVSIWPRFSEPSPHKYYYSSTKQERKEGNRVVRGEHLRRRKAAPWPCLPARLVPEEAAAAEEEEEELWGGRHGVGE